MFEWVKPRIEQPLAQLFEQIVPSDFALTTTSKLCIYTPRVVVWMMIEQWLEPGGTQASAVERLARGEMSALVAKHKRVREATVSPATGAYCRARTRLPVASVEQLTDRIFAHLMAERNSLRRPVFLLDGSSLSTPATDDLRKHFPPASNQHGESHWPTIRIVVAHEVECGLAVRPEWGAMYGPKASSEQALAEAVICRLPQEATVVGDRNFGVFSVAWHAQQNRRSAILRLTESRARKIAALSVASVLRSGTDRRLRWEPSRNDRRAHPELPADAVVEGRLIVTKLVRDGKPLHLYLFTTLDVSAEEVVRMYGLRWNIETDLRVLKRTIGLHHLRSKSSGMITKELLLAMSAYNLVRSVQSRAAATVEIAPRQLSFSRVCLVVNAWLPRLASITDKEEYDQQFQRMVANAARCRLPKRRKSRSYPRAAWGHKQMLPKRKAA